MDSKPNTPSYPGSHLSISQLLAALDQKIPAEIAWVESNARSKGVLAHSHKPEVWNYTLPFVSPLNVMSHR